jgi:hypothetical protein
MPYCEVVPKRCSKLRFTTRKGNYPMPKAIRGLHAHIADMLGVTESGLETLFRIKRGDNISGGQAGARLLRQRYVTDPIHAGGGYWMRSLTPAGLDICNRARTLGW